MMQARVYMSCRKENVGGHVKSGQRENRVVELFKDESTPQMFGYINREEQSINPLRMALKISLNLH